MTSEFTHRLPHRPWSKPSRNEEEYFRREAEFRRRMEAARRRESRVEDTEREELRSRHRGRCPKCGARMEAMELPEGRAEQCPSCLGVWMPNELFDRLTHPDQDQGSDFLTELLRGQFLQYTTGAVRRVDREKGEREETGGEG
jgi:Zn-finger nucleic acid-binding protein